MFQDYLMVVILIMKFWATAVREVLTWLLKPPKNKNNVDLNIKSKSTSKINLSIIKPQHQKQGKGTKPCKIIMLSKDLPIVYGQLKHKNKNINTDWSFYFKLYCFCPMKHSKIDCWKAAYKFSKWINSFLELGINLPRAGNMNRLDAGLQLLELIGAGPIFSSFLGTPWHSDGWSFAFGGLFVCLCLNKREWQEQQLLFIHKHLGTNSHGYIDLHIHHAKLLVKIWVRILFPYSYLHGLEY